jgi:hypothetical protein
LGVANANSRQSSHYTIRAETLGAGAAQAESARYQHQGAIVTFAPAIAEGAPNAVIHLGAITQWFQPPQANTDVAVVAPGETLELNAHQLLQNDTDPDGEPLTLSAVSAVSALGVPVILDGNTLVYQAPEDFSLGVDTISYEVADSTGGIDTGVLRIISREARGDLSIRFERDGPFEIRFQGLPSQTYLIQMSEDLGAAVGWETIATIEADASGAYSLESFPQASQGFIRAVLVE